LTAADRERLRARERRWQNPPRLSVLLPVQGASEQSLCRAMDSVLTQLYPQWELCVGLNPAGSSRIRIVLDEYAARDSRIKVAVLSHAASGADLCNAALELATGEYVALLHPDDSLAEHALHRVAEALTQNPETDFLYTDEDKVDPEGRHIEPFFKPDWSPEYFLAGPYTGNLGIYRAALVRSGGGFRPGYEPAHVYDLALRLSARTSQVGHIPDVLYHAHKPPAPGPQDAIASALARRAVDSYLAATGRPGRAEPGPLPGWHRVRFALSERPRVSIIIPTACKRTATDLGSSTYLLQCLDSIRKQTTYDNYEIVVVENDNATPPALALELARRGIVRVVYAGPVNLAVKMNRGAVCASGSHFLFLNDDITVITPDWIESLLEFSQQPEVGAVGARLLFPDGRIQHAGVTFLGGTPVHHFPLFPGDFSGYHANVAVHRNCSAVTGACLMTRTEVFRSLSGFSEIFAICYNDIDYCLRVLASGKRVVYQPFARLHHYESVTRQAGLSPEESRAFRQRWAHQWLRDPYYNVNLSNVYRDFRIAGTTEQGEAADPFGARAA
jgi:GT2 family glycosyltransferase